MGNSYSFDTSTRRPDGIVKRGHKYDITLFGVTRSLAEWSRVYGVKPCTAYRRIRNGMSPLRAMSDRRDLHFQWIDWSGEKRKLIDVAHEHGIPKPTLQSRLNAGWSMLDAATRPARRGKTVMMDGETQSIAAYCAKHDLPYSTVMYRIRHGMTPEEAIAKSHEDKQSRSE